MKKEIDEKLLASLQAQDPKGLEEAIRRYSPYVAGVLRKTLGAFGTREDLEELASDVFVALWQSAQKLRPHSDLKLWLGVVARNRAFKHLRSLKLELPLDDSFLPSPEEPASRFWERREAGPAGAPGGAEPGAHRPGDLPAPLFLAAGGGANQRRAAHEPLHREEPAEAWPGKAESTLEKGG